jgi:hypothetical protein
MGRCRAFHVSGGEDLIEELLKPLLRDRAHFCGLRRAFPQLQPAAG